MTLEQAQKEYPDAIQVKLPVDKTVLLTRNLYKENELREYLKTIFPSSSILYCSCSGNEVWAITSAEALSEENRQISIIPGTKVVMTGSEGDLPQYKNKVWEVTNGPQWMCGDLVVWLEGFSGAYSCKYLKIITED